MMRNPLNILFAALSIAAIVILSACANSPSLAQIQQAGSTLVSTIKTDVTLYESTHPVSSADQANITLALNSLSAANVVLQGLTATTTAAGYVQIAENVVSASVSVINALPAGTLPAATVDEINNAAFAFQLAAGLAQQIIASAPVTTSMLNVEATGLL